jgi:hypothetical protein
MQHGLAISRLQQSDRIPSDCPDPCLRVLPRSPVPFSLADLWYPRSYRWPCPDATCLIGTWTEQEPGIAAARLALTDRAGRWVTFQVGKHGRTVNEVASDLGCDWHTVNDAVIAYGSVLADDLLVSRV